MSSLSDSEAAVNRQDRLESLARLRGASLGSSIDYVKHVGYFWSDDSGH